MTALARRDLAHGASVAETRDLRRLVERYSLPVVQAYMQHIQQAAQRKMQAALERLPERVDALRAQPHATGGAMAAEGKEMLGRLLDRGAGGRRRR